MKNNSAVLDASAVLAYLQAEKGSEQVERLLTEEGDVIISAANYAEVVSKLCDVGMPESKIQVVLENLELRVMPVDEEQALLIGLLRIKTKKFGLSLGDRACIALGESLNLSIFTTDKQWDNIDSCVKITQLR